MSRKKSSIKNYIWANISTIVSLLFNFINKTVLIKTLGTTYVGINSLFTNILGILAITELGIGVAISFNLYEPLANNDKRKIQALINFYRKAYRIIALIITVMGAALIPFLPKIAKGTENVKYLSLIFCIYIFNTVSSYLLIYKTTIFNADQKNYLLTKINTAVFAAVNIIQIIVLLLTKNFVLYLLVSSIINLGKNVYLNIYTGKKYPYLKSRNKESLSKEEKNRFFVDIKAVFYHQVASVVISQTDSIVTSSFINVNVVGLVSNYQMLISVIRGFVSTVFTAIQPSFGNLIVTTDSEYRHKTFNRINFVAFWLANFTSICLFMLIEPFITVWIGNSFLMSKGVLILLVLNYYIFIMRNPVNIVHNAAGLYDKTKISPIIETLINLAVSIILVQIWGVEGVYVGTLVSTIVPVIWLTSAMYKYVYNVSSKPYFVSYVFRFVLTIAEAGALFYIANAVKIENVILTLAFRLLLCLIIPNIIIVLIYRKKEEYKYFIDLVVSFCNKRGLTDKRLVKAFTGFLELTTK